MRFFSKAVAADARDEGSTDASKRLPAASRRKLNNAVDVWCAKTTTTWEMKTGLGRAPLVLSFPLYTPTLNENEQERVEATLSLIKFEGLVSLFKSRTCEWIVIRTNSYGRVLGLYVGSSFTKVAVDDIEATAYTDVHPSPTTLPFPSILSPSLPRGTRQYGRHVSPLLIWS